MCLRKLTIIEKSATIRSGQISKGYFDQKFKKFKKSKFSELRCLIDRNKWSEFSDSLKM